MHTILSFEGGTQIQTLIIGIILRTKDPSQLINMLRWLLGWHLEKSQF